MFSICCNSCVNYEQTKKDPQRITKIKPFISTYNQEGINYPSEKDDWKKLEKNNVAIAVNVWYAKKEKIHPARENKLFFHDFKRRKIALSCSKKPINIIKRNNF